MKALAFLAGVYVVCVIIPAAHANAFSPIPEVSGAFGLSVPDSRDVMHATASRSSNCHLS